MVSWVLTSVVSEVEVGKIFFLFSSSSKLLCLRLLSMTEAVPRELGKDYGWPVALMDQGQENISTAWLSEIGFPGVLKARWSGGRCWGSCWGKGVQGG